MLFFNFVTLLAREGVQETLDESIQFSGTLNSSLALKNAKFEDDHLLLWSNSKETRPHITISTPNKNQEWSFEVHFSPPQLKYPQTSGLYVWYTKSIIDESKVNKDNFNGLVAGIEFVGNSVELTLAIHENKEEKVVQDHFDFSVIEEYEEVALKVIHTKNNLKLEIIHENEVVYDHLRLLDHKYFGDHGENGYFSLNAGYYQIDKAEAFRLRSIKLHKREEMENYNVHEEVLLMGANNDIDKTEMGHAIANLDHFMKYLKMMVGEPEGAQLAQIIVNTKKEIFAMSDQIAKVDRYINDHNEFDTRELHESTNRIESSIKGVQKEMMIFQKGIKELRKLSRESLLYTYIFVLCTMVTLGIIMIRNYKFRSSQGYIKDI